MKNTKMRIILLLITALLNALLLCGCQQVKQNEEPPTQEEMQAEFIEIMRYMGLLIPPNYDGELEDSNIVELAKGVLIYDKNLEIFLHVYELDTDFENIPTAEEVEGLYNQYDQVTYEKYYQFYDWYRNNGGAACDAYLDGMFIAYMNYKDEYGVDYKNCSWSDYTVANFIDFETYVKENPDYAETNYAYKRLLKWLGLEK